MASAFLFGYAAVLAGPVAWLIRRAGWSSRVPVLGLATWHVLVATILVAILLAAFAAIPPAAGDHREHDHLAVAEACLAAAVFLAAAAVTIGLSVLAYVRTRRSQRHQHRLLIGMAGHRDEQLDAIVVAHTRPAAYCVPGHDNQVVLTTAAIAALDDPALAALLAHERAHLSGRHHLALAAVRVLQFAFPFVPAFRWARDEVGRIVELLADDTAARRCGRNALARALVTMATDAQPSVASPIGLSADGPAVLTRVERLRAPAAPLGVAALIAWTLALLTLLAVPVLAAGSALAGAANVLSHCPFA